MAVLEQVPHAVTYAGQKSWLVRNWSLLIAIAALIAVVLMPTPPGLPVAGQRMLEVPLVIVDVMRVGPSTGIPSKTEQSDINISVYGWVIALRQICPVPMAALGQAFAGVTRTIVLEQNHSAQLFHYLRGRGAVGPECESIARPGPLPFRPNEIASLIG